MSYRNEIDKHFGQPWRPKPASLEQVKFLRPVPRTTVGEAPVEDDNGG
jgi:hypothetical protein